MKMFHLLMMNLGFLEVQLFDESDFVIEILFAFEVGAHTIFFAVSPEFIFMLFLLH